MSKGFYCPYCKETIYPDEIFENVYVHNDVEHPEDFKAEDFLVIQ